MARAVIPVQELDNRNEFAAAALNTAMWIKPTTTRP